MNDFDIVNNHKIICTNIVEEPVFQFCIQQYFVDDISDLEEGKPPNPENSCLFMTFNKKEFDFIWNQLFKYKLEKEIAESESQ